MTILTIRVNGRRRRVTLDPDKHSVQAGFLCHKDGRVIGRIEKVESK